MLLNEIMLIEDNPDDGEVITRGFKQCAPDQHITWFKSSQEALDYLLSNEDARPQVILLDLNLPGMDGRALLDLIKKHESLKKIPVLILTTSADQNDIRRCYESGANSYIQKPVNFYTMKEFCKGIYEYWFKVCILSSPDENRVNRGSGDQTESPLRVEA